MKTAPFLRCGVVIVLSLVAGRAGAQLDSNARVIVHSSIVCGGCNVQIVAVNETPPYTETDTIYQSGNACLDTDTSFSATGFNIDTNRKKIYGLTLTEVSYHPNTSFPCLDGSAYVFDILHVYFDSISYHDSSGSLIAQGIFSCSIKDSVIASGGSLHWDCNGSCAEGGMAVDTLTVEIIPNGYMNVSQPVTISETRSLVIHDQGTESLLATFPLSENLRILEVYDLLGRNAALISIPSNVEFIELPIASLPPGCYFARLGDQVAKFVVPPR